MNKIKEQIAKLEKELSLLKKEVNQSSRIVLGNLELDASGNPLQLTFDKAFEYAKLKGSRLATVQELRDYFASDSKSLEKENISLWSSELIGDNKVRVFAGIDGNIYHCYRNEQYHVRCVVPSKKGDLK